MDIHNNIDGKGLKATNFADGTADTDLATVGQLGGGGGSTYASAQIDTYISGLGESVPVANIHIPFPNFSVNPFIEISDLSQSVTAYEYIGGNHRYYITDCQFAVNESVLGYISGLNYGSAIITSATSTYVELNNNSVGTTLPLFIYRTKQLKVPVGIYDYSFTFATTSNISGITLKSNGTTFCKLFGNATYGGAGLGIIDFSTETILSIYGNGGGVYTPRRVYNPNFNIRRIG